MIADHLPRYHAVAGRDTAYTVEQSFVVDGHEVAWIRFDGTTDTLDEKGQPNGQRQYSGHSLYCECDFKEGVGWMVEQDGQMVNLDGGKKRCAARTTVIEQRHAVLRDAYIATAKLLADTSDLAPVILDLIEKAKAEEFLEDGSGAAFYGGYFYVQTVGLIVGPTWEQHVWLTIQRMCEAKQIMLYGMVVRPYVEIPPSWDEAFRLDCDGWIGIASLPSHDHMSQCWKLQVIDPAGSAYGEPLEVPLTHAPIFGPDVGDVQEAEVKLKELLDAAIASTASGSGHE